MAGIILCGSVNCIKSRVHSFFVKYKSPVFILSACRFNNVRFAI